MYRIDGCFLNSEELRLEITFLIPEIPSKAQVNLAVQSIPENDLILYQRVKLAVVYQLAGLALLESTHSSQLHQIFVEVDLIPDAVRFFGIHEVVSYSPFQKVSVAKFMLPCQLVHPQPCLPGVLVADELVKVFPCVGFFENDPFAIAASFIDFIGELVDKKTGRPQAVVLTEFLAHVQEPGGVVGLGKFLGIGHFIFQEI